MQEAVTGFLTNVERFLRWVYPGLLLLALLHLGRKTSLPEWQALRQQEVAVQVFALVAVTIVASILIYAGQRYFVHEIFIQYLLFLSGNGDAFNYAKQKGKPPPLRRRWCPTVFWEWSSRLNLESRSLPGGYSDLRDYSWGVTHALGLSAWLILLTSRYGEENSIVDKFEVWALVLGAVLALSWIWQEFRNVLPPLWGNIRELKRLLRSDNVLPPGSHGS